MRGVREAYSGQMHRLPLGKAAGQMKTYQAGAIRGECRSRLLRPRDVVRGNCDHVLRQEMRCAVANRCAPTPCF
jgi:hypothetical protein